MCYRCWTEMGKPSNVTPAAIEAAGLAKRLYELDASGADLHIVLDDWNLADENVAFCRSQLSESFDWSRYSEKVLLYFNERHTIPGLLDIERGILDLIEPMPESERGAMMALFDEYIDETGKEIRHDCARNA